MAEPQENEEKAKPKERSGAGAFLGMVLSGLLSLSIAFAIFMIGVVHEKRTADRERKALVHFFAVESVDIYAEACKSAHGLFVGNRHRQMAATRMADARTFGQAISLDADPSLVATLRSIYTRYARVERDLKSAYSFFRTKKKLTRSQISKIVIECTGMGEEVGEVLKIAAGEGVDATALSGLEASCSEAGKLTDAMAKQKEKLLPDVKLSRTSFDVGTWRGSTSIRFRISNFSDLPVTITKVTCSLEGVKVKAAARYDPEPGGKEIKPDGSLEYILAFPMKPTLPPGPFKGTLTIETDCHGYERFTLPITGTAHKP